MARSLRVSTNIKSASLAIALQASLLVACGSTNQIVFTVDAGSDAGADAGPDAGDAGADAGTDAGSDAGMPLPKYSIGGTVSGLTGSGLVLQDNGGDDLTVSQDGPFQFATDLTQGTPYTVTIKTQPSSPLQTCTVADPAGTVSSAVISIAISCTTLPSFSIGGSVSGLVGQGLVLEAADGETLPVTASGTFAFTGLVQSTLSYSVTVASQPFEPYQVCTVALGQGVVGSANVTDVAVTCGASPLYTIGGSVTGLAGSGLVLQDDGVDDLTILQNGNFIFATPLEEDVPYQATVRSQPVSPLQTCTISKPSGLVGPADVSTIAVACVTNPSFTIGGTVAGLTGAGLKLEDNGSDDLTVSQSGAFTFAHGLQGTTPYTISISAQPSGQFCAVTAGGEGVIGNANVSSVVVTCASTPFIPITLQVTGLQGAGLSLQNGGDTLAVSANGTTTFADQLASGQSYAVTVASQPAGPAQTCVLTGASGTASSGTAIAISVVCTTNPFFQISGTVTGVAGTGLVLTNNGGDALPIGSDGIFTFATQLQSGEVYSVEVAVQPSNPFQVCTVSNGFGTLGSAPVTTVAVACDTSDFYLIGGTVSGLTVIDGGTVNSVVLQDNGSNDTTVAANGNFIFTVLEQAGQTYNITVKTQPVNPALVCTVANGSGDDPADNGFNAAVTCAPAPAFSIGGTVAGLDGTGLVLTDNGVDPLTITSNGSFTFATARATGLDYNITVKTQPVSPAQTCSVQYASGLIAGAAVTNVGVVCITRSFSIGGTVTGLPAGSTLTLQDNGFDNRVVTGTTDGSTSIPFTFGSLVQSGKNYSAAVLTSTGPVSCSIASPSGTVSATGANITSIAVTCVPAFLISGTVSGDSGTGLQLNNSTTGETITIAKSATTFAFARAVTQAQGYAISVAAQPVSNSLACSYTAGTTAQSGSPTAAVSGIGFGCTPNTFAVGGTIAGLPSNSTITLLDNNADSTVITGTGATPLPFQFLTPLNSGATYAAKVSSSTGPVSCTIPSGANGTVANAAVAAIQIVCVPTFSIAGSISGYSGSGLQLTLKNSAGTLLQTSPITSSSTSFAFTVGVTQAAGYAVTITQPTSTPKQVCSFDTNSAAPSGIATANITNLVLDCASALFPIGGTITGLPTGTTVTLIDNSFDRITVNGTASGAPAFTFPTQLGSGESYSAAVVSATGLVSCTLASGGTGTATAAVTSIQIACVPGFSIAGTLTGYTGTGLQLFNSTTGETVTVAKGASTFTFVHAVSNQQGYAISVATIPNTPSQSCAAGASGSPLSGNPTANLTDVSLSCSNNSFLVGGFANGLPAGSTVTITNGSDSVTVSGVATGATPVPFAFPNQVPSGATYTALVTATATTGPNFCTLASGGSGTVASSAVTTIVVNCVPAFFISGTLALYTGTGLQLKNTTTGELITVAQGQPGFAFQHAVTTALGYSLSVVVQPVSPAQSCNLSVDSPSPASGKPTANISNIAFFCTTSLIKVGGTISGLPAGTSVKLLDNGFDQLTVNGSSDGSTPAAFNFNTSLSSGSSYSANVVSTTGGIVCAMSGNSGAVGNSAVTTILVACAPSFTISGTIDGYAGVGLILSNSTSGESLTVAKGAKTFAFVQPVSQAEGYSISVKSPPVNPVESCGLSPISAAPLTGNPTGNVTNIALGCSSATFTVGGTVNGLAGNGLALQDNGGDDLQFGVQTPDYPTFTFATPIASGGSYSVTVKSQPAGLICIPRDGTAIGLVTDAVINTVIIDCAPEHLLGGVVNGLLGSGLFVSDGTESLAIKANAGATVPFTFRAPLAEGQSYFTSIAAQPVSPSQICTAGGGTSGNGDGSGTIGPGDDLSLVISCGPPAYPIGGTIIGAANGTADALALLDNGIEQLVISTQPAGTGAATPFVFTTPVVSGQAYAVTVETPPDNLACIVRNGTGVVGSSAVNSVQVICGFPLAGNFDLGTLNGVPGQLSNFNLTLNDSIVPGTSADPYTDSEEETADAGTGFFVFNDPVPYGRSCTLAISGTSSDADSSCFFETNGGCNGTAVTAPLTPILRCNPVPAIALVPFPGATGSSYAVGTNSSGDVAAGLEFTGAVDLGHGARTGSTFKSGTNKVIGSGAIVQLDFNGYKGVDANPAAANWDQLLPTIGSVKANVGAAKVHALAEDAAGDIVAGGSFIGSVDFGDGNGAFNAGATESMFLALYNNAGALVWAHPFGAGAIGSVATNGTTIVVGGVFGTTNSTETFASKTGTTLVPCIALTATTAHRDFVASFDLAAGGCGFSVNIGTGNDPQSLPVRPGPAVGLDSAGNLLAAGNALDANDPTRLAGPYLLSYNRAGTLQCLAGNSGNELYQDSTGAAKDQLNSMLIAANDTVYLTGSCQGSPKLQGAAVTGCNSAAPSAFIAQYAASAACVGTEMVGTQAGGAVLSKIAGGGSSTGLAIAADASENIYLAGNYSGAPSFSGTTIASGSATLTQNIFLAFFSNAALTNPLIEALNATGTISATGVAPGLSGSAWLSGSYNGTVTYKGTTTLGTTAAAPEPLLVQFPQVAP